MVEKVKTERKYWKALLVSIGMVAGVCSAAVLAHNLFLKNDAVNIFLKTKGECKDLKWPVATDSMQKVFQISIAGDVFFAGERVPLEDPDVRERLERELQLNAYWHSNTMMNMKLANRYFDDIERILIEQGVPTDFKYMPLVESGFKQDVSPAGAAGFWQFIKGTAKMYGLEVNEEVDERYNVELATTAACAYLKNAKEKLGNWTIAGASYNLGVPGMMQRIKDQRTNNFYNMYFNPETSRYVFRMLAMKIIFSHPERVGYYIKPEELYQPYQYKVVEVDTAIANIADFAAQYNLQYKHIKILNTWLRDAKLTNKERKKYQIKILQQ